MDLRTLTDQDVSRYLEELFLREADEGDRWRVLGAAAELSRTHSFSENKTYPRPDHPDPRKRLPLSYLLAAIIVSLRTTLENEQRATDTLIARFPREEQLLGATDREIAECISVAGMAEAKATRIVEALSQISTLPAGLETLRTWDLPTARAYLLALPGFGPKAADCMLSIGLGFASVVVDVNVFRFTASLLGLEWWRAASYSNNRQVSEVKDRLDAAIRGDALLGQVVHTLFLLEGKRRRIHAHSLCTLHRYCRACEESSIRPLF